MIGDNHTLEIFFHDIAAGVNHLDHAVVDGIHLGMEFQTGHTVTDINQTGAGIFLNDLLLFFQRGQEDDLRIFLDLHIALGCKIIVVLTVVLLGVEGFATGFQHFFDLLGNFLLELLHDFDGFLHTHGIPGFEGTELLIVAPLHGVIDIHDVVADFGNPVGGIDEIVAEIFADEFGGRIIAVEKDFHLGADTAFCSYWLRRRIQTAPSAPVCIPCVL